MPVINPPSHAELAGRLRHLQERLQQEGIGLALILQNTDLYYYAGTMMDATLAVPEKGEPVLFVRRGIDRAREETPWEIVPFRSFREILPVLKEKGFPVIGKLGLELDVLPYVYVQRIAAAFPGVEVVDISPLIRGLRAIKSSYEVQCIREAVTMQMSLYEEVKHVLRPGITELELSAHLEFILRQQGHQGSARMRSYNHEVTFGAVAAGVSALRSSKMDSPCGGPGISPANPFGAGWHRIQEGEPVLVDLLGTSQGYLSDQTRIFVLGQASAELCRAYEAMRRVQEAILAVLKPKVPWEGVYYTAVQEAERLGYGSYFMGQEGNRVRFVGHGIGLELDEYPLLAPGFTQPLETGMVVAVEPKVALPGLGVVGIENTFLIEPTGPQRLTMEEDDLVVIRV